MKWFFIMIFVIFFPHLSQAQEKSKEHNHAVIDEKDAVPVSILDGKASVKFLVSKDNQQKTDIYVGIFEGKEGLAVKEHSHAKEAEILYCLEGEGIMTIEGEPNSVTKGTAVYIPPETKHSFEIKQGKSFKALQIFQPAGPEERFRKK
ncbi:MAG: cupin domain-containing protein [Deltaproteobacteria bacterium]|nr:cupin domain-containing protein [Deltaproteobacteria bacterium]